MDIYESPASRHVAEFIGQVNIFGRRAGRDMEINCASIECSELDRALSIIGHGITSNTRAQDKKMTYARGPKKSGQHRKTHEQGIQLGAWQDFTTSPTWAAHVGVLYQIWN